MAAPLALIEDAPHRRRRASCRSAARSTSAPRPALREWLDRASDGGTRSRRGRPRPRRLHGGQRRLRAVRRGRAAGAQRGAAHGRLHATPRTLRLFDVCRARPTCCTSCRDRASIAPAGSWDDDDDVRAARLDEWLERYAAGASSRVVDAREVQAVRRRGRARLGARAPVEQLRERLERAGARRRPASIVPTSVRFMWRMNASAVIQNSSTSPCSRHSALEDVALEADVVGLGRRERGEVVRAGQQRARTRAAPRGRARCGQCSERPRSNALGRAARAAPGSSRSASGRRGARRSRRAPRAPRVTATSGGVSALSPSSGGRRARVRRDLPPRVHAAVGAPGDGRARPARAAASPSAASSSPCTVRCPGCRAQPKNAPPSYSRSSRVIMRGRDAAIPPRAGARGRGVVAGGGRPSACHGWLLRATPGAAGRRLNSALARPRAAARIEAVEALVRQMAPLVAGRPRSRTSAELDAELEARGWTREAATAGPGGAGETSRAPAPGGRGPERGRRGYRRGAALGETA